MKRIFQTTFGYPTGNCFNAAVASVLELDELPAIDPMLPDEEWTLQWCEFFSSRRLKWESRTYEPENCNWNCFPSGIAIAHIEVAKGILHAVVCEDGRPVHDVMPSNYPFQQWPESRQKLCRIVSWSFFRPLSANDINSFVGTEKSDFTPAIYTARPSLS